MFRSRCGIIEAVVIAVVLGGITCGLASFASPQLYRSVGAESHRSGKWPALEKKMLAEHPACALCGRAFDKNHPGRVHHLRPVAHYKESELLESNLVCLCPECHENFAHLDRHFNCWNPLLMEEIKLHKAMVAARPKTPAEAAKFVKRFKRCFEEANYSTAP
jgi:hypothetical protein